MKAALEDMDANPITVDASAEIDDDWLNLFIRLSGGQEFRTASAVVRKNSVRRDSQTGVILAAHCAANVNYFEARRRRSLNTFVVRSQWNDTAV